MLTNKIGKLSLSLGCHLLYKKHNCSSSTGSIKRMAQVAFNHPAPPPSTNSEPGHLKVLHLANTFAYQRPTTNKHHCLGTSQRTKLCGTAGGGGEVGRTCIKWRSCTCGATSTQRLQTDALTLLRESLRTVTEASCEGVIHWIINFPLVEDYYFC